MRSLEGGCQVPIGCYTKLIADEITIKAFVASPDGEQFLIHAIKGDKNEPEKLGQQLAEVLINKGATQILEAIRIN